MRALFVHEVNYLTKPIYEMHEFPEGLASKGHEIHFLHFPESDFLSKPSKGRILEFALRTRTGSDVYLHTPFSVGLPALDRILAVASHFFYLGFLLKKFRFDVVVIYGVPTNGASAIFWARRLGIPTIYRAIDVSHRIRKSVFNSAIKSVEKFVIRNVDAVSANNAAMIEYCQQFAGRSKGVHLHLPPLDLNIFVKQQKRFRWQKPLRLLYVGSFFYFSGLPQVLEELAAQVRKDPGSLTLTIVGFGEQEQELKALVKELNLADYVRFTGYIPYEELPGVIAEHDICLNPMEPSEVSDFALPNKVLQYLAMGKPVVSTKLTGLSMTFSNSIALYYANSANLVLKTVSKVLEDGEIERKLKATEVEVGQFRAEVAISNFEAFLQEVVTRN